METRATLVQKLPRRNLKTYRIMEQLWHATCMIHAVRMASLLYCDKQFWVYDKDRTRLLGVMRRIDY